MPASAGRNGNVKIGANSVAEINKWSLNISADKIPVHKFGDQWQNFLASLRGATGSLSGNWDMTDTNGQVALQNAVLAGNPVTLDLYTNATNKYSGSALLDEAVDTDNTKEVAISFNFTFTGAVTYS